MSRLLRYLTCERTRVAEKIPGLDFYITVPNEFLEHHEDEWRRDGSLRNITRMTLREEFTQPID
jgi:hypothetical protein